jgi:hypothetical protein
MDNVTQLREKVAALQDALLTSNPLMPSLLRQIHTQLRDDPEIVTLLSEEDICGIVNGLKRQTATELTSATLKSKTKSLKTLSVGDL